MKADEQIRLFNNNKMPLKPGCDPIQVITTTIIVASVVSRAACLPPVFEARPRDPPGVAYRWQPRALAAYM